MSDCLPERGMDAELVCWERLCLQRTAPSQHHSGAGAGQMLWLQPASCSLTQRMKAVSAWTPKSTHRSLSISFNVGDTNSMIFASSPNISFESKNSFFIISHHNLKLIFDPNSGLNLILAINQKVFSASYYPPAGQSAKKQANIITTVWYCNPAQHFASCHCHTGRQNKAVRSVPTQILFRTRWNCTEAVQSFKSFCLECVSNMNGNLVTSKPETPSVVRNWHC